MQRKQKKQMRRLTVERLTERILLAGDVAVSVSRRDLVVRGDDEDNQIDIWQPEAGVFRIEGRDDTTVNGAAFVEFHGVSRDIKIRMQQGGEDDVYLAGPLTVPDDLDVRVRAGIVTVDGSASQVLIRDDFRFSGEREVDLVLLNDVSIGDDAQVKTRGSITVAAGKAALPDFGSAAFDNSLTIDNPYFPLVAGTTYSYDVEQINEDTGEIETEFILVEVLADTRNILGVEARVVRDRVWLEGVLIEDTIDWYAQDNEGNVWYLGEIAVNFEYDEQGNLIGTNTGGSWEAGVDGALPGIRMESDPNVGDRYYQEFLPRIAIDQGEIVAIDESWTVPIGSFDNVLRTKDTTTLDAAVLEYKLYAPGLGAIVEQDIDLATGEVLGTATPMCMSSTRCSWMNSRSNSITMTTRSP